MFRTLRAKLIVTYAGIAVLCLMLALGVLLLLARDYAQRNSFKTLDEKKALVIPYVRLLVAGEMRGDAGGPPASKRILSGVRESIGGSGIRVLLVDPNTMVVMEDTSARFNAEGERFLFNDEDTTHFYQQLANGEVRDTSVLPGGGGAYQYIAQRIRMDLPAKSLLEAIAAGSEGSEVVKPGRLAQVPFAPYIVVLAQPVPQVGALLTEVRDYIIPAILVALAISFAAAYLLGRQISRPVARLANAARAVGRGDYSQQVPVEGNDELSTLTQQFNEMASEVGRAHQIQRDFVANVSHDLKTPLTSIQGFSQAILDGATKTQADYRQAASIINTEAQRMNRMVSELLSLVSLQNGLASLDMRPVQIAPVLSQLVLSMQPQAEQASVQLSAQFGRSSAVVLADVDRLKQAFANLMENALKYTPPGGTVTVRLEEVNGSVAVQIEDTGRGIPEADIRRVTERFYQVDKSRSATDGRSLGLGLAIAQEIIYAHGAQFTISSAQAVGTTVRVTLPAQTGRQASSGHGTWPRLNPEARLENGGTAPIGKAGNGGIAPDAASEPREISKVNRN
jgi:signal transduction histidine kinase